MEQMMFEYVKKENQFLKENRSAYPKLAQKDSCTHYGDWERQKKVFENNTFSFTTWTLFFMFI